MIDISLYEAGHNYPRWSCTLTETAILLPDSLDHGISWVSSSLGTCCDRRREVLFLFPTAFRLSRPNTSANEVLHSDVE